MAVYQSVLEMIGNTPMLHANAFAKANGVGGLFVKLEGYNPAGSSKDRAAYSMLKEAKKKGLLQAGGTIIEPTSGNTGIGLALIAIAEGYHVILTMPDTMSVERRTLLQAYGAQLVLTEGALGMKGAIEKAEELLKTIPNSFMPQQFENEANALAHYEGTGPEIYRDMQGKVDIFVASVGTGGTLSGVGAYLKEQNAQIQVVAVEPLSSPLLSKGYAGAHQIQGIGANFIPKLLKPIYDQVIAVSDEDAFHYARQMATTEGVLVGISSGAVLCAGVQLAKQYSDKNIVLLLPDRGDRYLSTLLFQK